MDVRYPIGTFECPERISEEQKRAWIEEIRTFPEQLKEAVTQLSEAELEKQYREGSWTIRQIVHHVADSHMNAYIRFKLAVTEEEPTIKPYDQDDWAKLPDSRMPISVSLQLLEGLHARLACLLESLSEEQGRRIFHHPESGVVSVEKNIGMYAWHGKHHLAQIRQALQL